MANRVGAVLNAEGFDGVLSIKRNGIVASPRAKEEITGAIYIDTVSVSSSIGYSIRFFLILYTRTGINQMIYINNAPERVYFSSYCIVFIPEQVYY